MAHPNSQPAWGGQVERTGVAAFQMQFSAVVSHPKEIQCAAFKRFGWTGPNQVMDRKWPEMGMAFPEMP